MPALDAYHSKQTAYAGLHTRAFGWFLDAFLGSLNGEQGEAGSPVSIEAWGRDADAVTARLARTLNVGETFYVSPLMTRLVSAAAEQWPEDEPVMPEDFITDRGWLFIPGGVTVLDIRGALVTTSALSWEVLGGKVYVAMWCDKEHDPPDYRSRPGWKDAAKFTPWHLSDITLGRPLHKTVRMGTLLPPEVSQQITYTDNAVYFPHGWTAEELAPTVKPDEILAWLVSALRIMQQPLATGERHGLPAAVRRQHRLTRFRVKSTSVTVIDFRRRESDFAGHGDREYTHRFLRRGHWRRTPYKRPDGSWDRRRVWIHATIVGDPSLPLVLREHVNALSR